MNWCDLVAKEHIKIADVLVFHGKQKTVSAVVQGKFQIYCEVEEFLSKRPSIIWASLFKVCSQINYFTHVIDCCLGLCVVCCRNAEKSALDGTHVPGKAYHQ